MIVGGGDSAFDWAQHLEPVARSITLVHRRDAFRAHARTVEAVRDSSVEIVTRAQVTALRGEETLAEVEITVDGQEPVVKPAQAVVAALGFIADLGPLQEWGIEVEKRHVVVSPSMRTVAAAGVRGRRHHGVRGQGPADRRRVRRGRDRRQQRGRRDRPVGARVPRTLQRGDLTRDRPHPRRPQEGMTR